MEITVILILAVLLALTVYMLARAVNQIIYLREDLQSATDTEHIKCMGAVMKYVGDAFAAKVLEAAAADYGSVEEQSHLKTLANLRYQPGGPSMPAIWLQDRAERLRILDSTDGS